MSSSVFVDLFSGYGVNKIVHPVYKTTSSEYGHYTPRYFSKCLLTFSGISNKYNYYNNYFLFPFVAHIRFLIGQIRNNLHYIWIFHAKVLSIAGIFLEAITSQIICITVACTEIFH